MDSEKLTNSLEMKSIVNVIIYWIIIFLSIRR